MGYVNYVQITMVLRYSLYLYKGLVSQHKSLVGQPNLLSNF